MNYPDFFSLRGHHFYTKLLNQNSVVIDLGANRGEFSCQITNIFGCRSYAVEASPKLFPVIPESTLIKKFNYAINNTNQLINFNLALNDECSSINQLPDNMTQEVFTIEGITLEKFLSDNQIETIDLLKIDIEGAEIKLFHSISKETLLSIKQITVEFHDFMFPEIATEVKKIKQRLCNIGFSYIVYSWKTNEDVLFLNNRYCDFSKINFLYAKLIDKYIKGIKRYSKRIVNNFIKKI